MRLHNRSYLIERRRQLRKRSTTAETIFWRHVRNKKLNGLKFRRQHSIGNYIVDFYCDSAKLVIEIDGEIHDTESQNKKDGIRDENLKNMGFTILRFKNEDIKQSIGSVKLKILEHISPSPF
jgi:very-short-patch-repair endonuclease